MGKFGWALPGTRSKPTWIVDDTGFLEPGNAFCWREAAYTGSAGKIANCQVGVSSVVASLPPLPPATRPITMLAAPIYPSCITDSLVVVIARPECQSPATKDDIAPCVLVPSRYCWLRVRQS